jgi:sulfur carrier protein ThiS
MQLTDAFLIHRMENQVTSGISSRGMEPIMPVRIELCPTLRKRVLNYHPDEGLELQDCRGLTIKVVLQRLNLPVDEVQLMVVNRKIVRPDYPLREGDRLALFAVVDGG